MMSINKQRLAWAFSCLSILTGCASFYSNKEYSALQIKPVMNVRHADTSAENLYQMARYHHRKTSYATAIEFYKRVLAVTPDYVEAHNGLGVIYSTQGEYPLALEHFHKAISIAPSATYLYNNLGYAHLIQGQNSEAVAAFQEALNFDPDNHKARQNLAMAQKRMGVVEGMAIFSPIIKKPGEISASVPQNLPAKQNSRQQQLVQVAPNVYEFKVEQEKLQPIPMAAPVSRAAPRPASTPVIASPSTSPIYLTSLAHDQAEKSVPKNSNSVAVEQNKRIEISNGNGVTGMAKDMATFLKLYGFDNARITNHPTFQQSQTEIHYHTDAHTHAERISQLMPGQVKMIENNELREDTQLKILLGKDIASEMAYFIKQGNIRFTQNMLAFAPED
ncbi:LytR C-terminal domain-containing protein [Nitrosomonas communis]|uniref:Tetratricopeptide repeat-containing protein n=1 Tax=Nitrosomonas communis TaxID=44574 RepID=A0A1H2QFP7_9PROT|nr:LytR C-terminal domain-containing protein [Nitrosomonas communis]SDW05962.1 Tetratricopeptide repeat-containing protein [Nitrosomonas communis]